MQWNKHQNLGKQSKSATNQYESINEDSLRENWDEVRKRELKERILISDDSRINSEVIQFEPGKFY